MSKKPEKPKTREAQVANGTGDNPVFAAIIQRQRQGFCLALLA
jgi:hypothetical protein